MSLDFLGQGWRGTCTAAPSATTRLLAWASRNAIPMAISVHVKGNTLADGANNPRSTVLQYLRCNAVVGGIAKQFEVDLRAGGVAFDLVCESITIDVVSDDADAADTLFCFGAITRYVQGAPWRSPIRTVRVTYAAAGSVTAAFPRYAGSLLAVQRSAVGNIKLSIRDADNTVITPLVISLTSNALITALPLGADTWLNTDAWGVAETAAYVFELNV